MRSLTARLALPLVLAVVAVLSIAPRAVLHARLVLRPGADWVTFDNDAFYHMRRVARVLDEGLPVAERDPYLDHPAGARVPWPPYYTLLLSGALAPFAPEDAQERRGFIERGVGDSGIVFGVLASLLAALVGWSLARAPGALFCGAYHALAYGSITYSRSGIGDHHAFVSLLSGAVLAILARALAARDSEHGALERPGRALRGGVLAGALAGVALGAWAGSLLYVIHVQLVFGILLFVDARRRLPGLVPLGLGFHLAAAIACLPAVLSSAWRESTPWIVVNLSWFHPLFLLVGAAVFVPLPLLGPGSFVRRHYPWFAGLGLALLAALLWLVDAAPARGVLEGLAWVSRVEAFMSEIQESRPLVGAGANGLQRAFRYLGYGVLLVPVAWLALCHQAWRRGRLELLPWIVALPPLLLQALRQVRFADALTLPLAVGLGAALALLVPRLASASAGHGRRLAIALAALVVACAAQLPTLRTMQDVRRLGPRARAVNLRHEIGERMMLNWIRRRTPPGGGYGVMAAWTHGHGIEWVADRPSVATNFGTYTAQEGYFDSARFFLAEEPRAAEELLERRGVRYVYLTSSFPASLRQSVPALFPEGPNPFVTNLDELRGFRPGTPDLTERWLGTMGARLMNGGRVFGREDGALGFLRLVHAAQAIDPEPRIREFGVPSPMGWVWERVAGARVRARAAPGTPLRVRIDLRYGPAELPQHFEARAVAGADGIASLRVPYGTTAPNGDGRVHGRASYTLGVRSGELVVPMGAVLEGGEVWLER